MTHPCITSITIKDTHHTYVDALPTTPTIQVKQYIECEVELDHIPGTITLMMDYGKNVSISQDSTLSSIVMTGAFRADGSEQTTRVSYRIHHCIHIRDALDIHYLPDATMDVPMVQRLLNDICIDGYQRWLYIHRISKALATYLYHQPRHGTPASIGDAAPTQEWTDIIGLKPIDDPYSICINLRHNSSYTPHTSITIPIAHRPHDLCLGYTPISPPRRTQDIQHNQRTIEQVLQIQDSNAFVRALPSMDVCTGVHLMNAMLGHYIVQAKDMTHHERMQEMQVCRSHFPMLFPDAP